MEDVLKADAHRSIVRVGDTVRRSQYPWSSSVHLLLLHLEQVGFPWSPRFLGIDAEDREVLSFIDGIAGADGYVAGVEFGAHVWSMVVAPEGLARFARLLREYHDAVAGFVAPDDTRWASGRGAPAGGEVMCHNDFGPWNVVWVDGHPGGIIDWDYAAPGSPVDDVAYALEWSVPFCSDEDCLKWRRFPASPERRDRIELFAAAYGLTSSAGLVDAVIDRQQAFRSRVTALAEEGIQPAVDEVATGYLDEVDARIQWTLRHRHLLE